MKTGKWEHCPEFNGKYDGGWVYFHIDVDGSIFAERCKYSGSYVGSVFKNSAGDGFRFLCIPMEKRK